MPVAFSISVLSRDRRSKAFKRHTADPSNLRPVIHQSKIAVETKCNSIKLAFLNTRSLKNKSFVINDLITTNNLDFMFLIETWLEDNCSATVPTETGHLTPQIFLSKKQIDSKRSLAADTAPCSLIREHGLRK